MLGDDFQRSFVEVERMLNKIHHVFLHNDASHASETIILTEHFFLVGILVNPVGRVFRSVSEETNEAPRGTEGDAVPFDILGFRRPIPVGCGCVVAAPDVADKFSLSRHNRKAQEPSVGVNDVTDIHLGIEYELVADFGAPVNKFHPFRQGRGACNRLDGDEGEGRDAEKNTQRRTGASGKQSKTF